MADQTPDSWSQKLMHYCRMNDIEFRWQDYSDPRGIRTAWTSSVFVRGEEYRCKLYREYEFIGQCREEAAELAYKELVAQQQSPNGYRGRGMSG
ncbi:hypothetical protein M011DRAFT_475285 [Sporormia fimetaria CBS 119925]|uniref:DRBM domain-containing protein n=1 Tax=Sporormia fimetaria CBS 119925 TaxID=1340428 RepID=A0A6A6VHA6_9PLEO|nr:hypothetical protein M011DRAFT_475285 [Sporormia fimetaria CBS 119925]